MSAPCPQLLVSVRDASEAHQAILGGADVLDFKNPEKGSLGPVEDQEIWSICGRLCKPSAGRIPILSAALGELREIAIPRLPSGVRYVKLGLSEMRGRREWRELWNSARIRFRGANSSDVRWVAVAYADDESAGAPPVDEILQEAGRSACAGLLIDTFDKRSGRLLDILGVTTLRTLRLAAHDSGMFFAVAGRLQAADIPQILDVGPDIVAVRSAACEGDNRMGRVVADRVASLREALLRPHSFRASGLEDFYSQGTTSADSDRKLTQDTTSGSPSAPK